MFTEINCKKSCKTNTVSWKKTLKTIHQLSCFVGHPVIERNDYMADQITEIRRQGGFYILFYV